MRSKMFMSKSIKYDPINGIKTLDVGLYDTHEDALQAGKNAIFDHCYNNSTKDLLTDEDVLEFINSEKTMDIEYSIRISTVSTSRKKFNTSKELMEYFNTTIKSIPNNKLYDFLLSLVVSDDNVYDYQYNLLFNQIFEQCPMKEIGYSSNVDFNEEDCKNGIYTFEYEIYRD